MHLTHRETASTKLALLLQEGQSGFHAGTLFGCLESLDIPEFQSQQTSSDFRLVIVRRFSFRQQTTSYSLQTQRINSQQLQITLQ